MVDVLDWKIPLHELVSLFIVGVLSVKLLIVCIGVLRLCVSMFEIFEFVLVRGFIYVCK